MSSLEDVGELTIVRSDLSIPQQHLAVEADEDVNYIVMMMASRQRASILLYLQQAGYDIKLFNSDGFSPAMSHVKWSIPNPYGSTVVYLFEGPATDLLRHAVMDLRSL
ncbi:La-related protein 6 [Hordeum vulgare]|nr:La-related protein 6 [Hordeum vulgare]